MCVVFAGVRWCAHVCTGVHRCAQVCTGVCKYIYTYVGGCGCGYAYMYMGVCRCEWVGACARGCVRNAQVSLLESSVNTSADFNTYPIRIFLICAVASFCITIFFNVCT